MNFGGSNRQRGEERERAFIEKRGMRFKERRVEREFWDLGYFFRTTCLES